MTTSSLRAVSEGVGHHLVLVRIAGPANHPDAMARAPTFSVVVGLTSHSMILICVGDPRKGLGSVLFFLLVLAFVSPVLWRGAGQSVSSVASRSARGRTTSMPH